MGEATSDPVRLPPMVLVPKMMQGLAFVVARKKAARCVARRYGATFTLNLPIFGPTVVVGDPALVKDVFTTGTDQIARASMLGKVLGPGSTFSLDGDEHRQRRKLLVPPFHGRRMQGYEQIIEDEVMRETATWPSGQEFGTLKPMMRITLNAILRAVFGAEGAELDELRELLPPAVALGSRMAVVPTALRRDLGPWSPWARFLDYRRRCDAVIDSLIARARSDRPLQDRSDVLSLLLGARYDNGEPISDRHIVDELLTLLTAGHETTATTLAWTIERLRRHPSLLARLTEEVDAGGSELRQATIWEVQRTRPVIDVTLRRTKQRVRLGEWVIPEEHSIMVSIGLVHESQESFPGAETFNPDRFVGSPPDTYAWIPFGGGVHRCIGAAFANMEMNVTLRTLLREFTFAPTRARGERVHSRGVATAPGCGGRAVVYRRSVSVPVNAAGEPAFRHGR